MTNGYVVILLAFLLVAFLLYKEFTRKRKASLYARLLSSVVAVASLCLLAYPFANKKLASSHTIAIITPGFSKDSVADFLQRDENSQLYSVAMHENIGAKKSFLITNMLAFAAQHADDTLHVFGNGFDKEALQQLQPHPIIFHAAPVLSAITHIYWKQNITAGEELLLQGNYVNNRQQPVKIILQAFGQNKDSLSIAAGLQQDFQFQTLPLHTGNAVYKLITVAGKDTIAIEPIPIKVQPTVPLQLLMLSASPDFDNTYLKNQLVQQGYKVAINTTVSTNKTNTQYINVPAQTASNAITNNNPGKFGEDDACANRFRSFCNSGEGAWLNHKNGKREWTTKILLALFPNKGIAKRQISLANITRGRQQSI